MSYSKEQLMTALRKADAAGDTEGAKRIAGMIKAQPQQAEQPQQQPEPQQDKGIISSAAEMVTGSDRMTPEMESMSEIGNAPELNEMSWSAFKTSLGLLATGDDEKAQGIIKTNIPEAEFTKDSQGNTIVNLPSGSYALNKPGISPQDIAKGVFDIAAFTPAGRAGSVAKAAAGAGATEAGLQQVASSLGGGEVDMGDIAASAALGGVGKFAEDAIGAGYRAFKGAPDSEAQKVAQFAKEQELPLMTTDVVEPSTFVGKSAQSAAEKVPVTGTGTLRAKQQEAREGLISDYAKQFEPYDPSEVVESLQRQTSKVKKAAGNARQSVMNQMDQTPISTSNAVDAIDDEIARLSKTPSGEARSTADNATIEKLEAYKSDITKDPTFSNIEQLRTQFRVDVKGDRMVMPSRSEASIGRIYSAMGKDMDESITSNLGDAAARKWKQSNAVYANEANKIKNTRLKSVLQKGDLTPEVVNNLIYSNKPSEFKTLYRSLDTKGKSAARSALIGKAFDKSGGSPERFVNELDKMGSQLGLAFKGEDKKFLDGMTNYINATRQAGRAEVVTPTGQQLFQIALPAGIAADVGTTGGLNIAAGLGYGGLARAYESKAVRNAMLKLNAIPKGSTAYEQQLAKISTLLSAYAQAARREEE
ncbi:hypothetical protein NVP1039O_15 [Vibrio phage 1.039.O._10N.286.55.A2]|nr:hypothetical protein NVP1039O_15 [Vibrio phage 1.039.O._10N.286.55.A2]AUR84597.1 hypothetical protein NVP1061O_16 [Vibrio phage 1.061.O._10N.286.55.C2]